MATQLEMPQGVRKARSNAQNDTISIATRGPKGFAFRKYLDTRFPGMSAVDQLEQLIAADVQAAPANAKNWKTVVEATNEFIKQQQ